MKTLISILTALLLLGASPALAGERGGGGGGHGGGGGCGGGCGGGGGGGHPGGGGGHYGGNINVNVNANANAYAGAYAGAGSYINARASDVGAIRGQGGYGGVISTGGGGGVGDYGYASGGYGPVVVSGPGYGPSRPFGYVAQGFGRRYVTTDRCCGLRPAPCYASACGGGYPPAPPPPPPPPPSCNCQGGYQGGYQDGHGYQQSYSGGRGDASYSRYESYSESSGYQGGRAYAEHRDDGPRYAPIPYNASPLEPVSYDQGGYGYAPPPVQYSRPAYAEPAYAPVEPQVYQPAPVYIQQPPLGYYGDLPPGDTGEGMPYRQEPGERG